MYCDSYDVASNLKRFQSGFTSLTEPSNAEVDDFCDEVSVEIDATCIAAGVALPLTGANPLKLAKSWAILGASARVLRAAEVEPERADVLQKMFDEKLKLLLKNPAMLQDATIEQEAPGLKGAIGLETRRFHVGEKDW